MPETPGIGASARRLGSALVLAAHGKLLAYLERLEASYKILVVRGEIQMDQAQTALQNFRGMPTAKVIRMIWA